MNTRLFLEINDLARATPWLHAPLVDYAKYGVALFAALLLAGWWTARQRGTGLPAAVWAPVGMLLAVAGNQLIVAAVHEPRPYTALPGILVLADRSGDPSFPSDHATMAGAVAAGLLLVSWRLGLLAVAAAAVMGFARIYIGAHYPADVLAGFGVGAGVTLLGYLIARRPIGAGLDRLDQTRLRPLLRSGGGVADEAAAARL
ncbi:phosphatase PAP2 family protein [Micromonospora soli]|uniref:phosphatase PAP2 family protein n=1 Tax=Micromonospora sp. NBRC 110009 TaxID=3061627 RepID=UPI00267262DF|nr:phosphatase PAP2 family protein [Micromonospora sp. NBRC 110009]WKT97020.1 phosphatase PAP2 family protein [Micromonospora sp. NBRC 110009]